ncbi:MAG TPA: hypothetical protein VLI54_04315 [Bacillota bacterium]|nr:hypothetical protein [Bacillota bacterium]
MSFQQWEIPFGEEGYGPNLQAAVLDAIGSAIARELVGVSDLPPAAQAYSLREGEVDEDVGLEVFENNLAICMGMPFAALEAWQEARPPLYWPRIVILPNERAWQSVHTASWGASGLVAARVFRVVRHVESTPLWTDWLRQTHSV